MKVITSILSLILLSFNVAAIECLRAPDDIQTAIDHHIQKIRADEYCKARAVKTEGNITIAIYTAEGACEGISKTAKPGSCSNNWVRYMVGSINGKIIEPIKVGGKGDLSDREIKIMDGTIEVTGLTTGPNDPLCCPSAPKIKIFKFSPDGFREIKP